METVATPNLVGQAYAKCKRSDHYDVMLEEKVFDASIQKEILFPKRQNRGTPCKMFPVVKVSQGMREKENTAGGGGTMASDLVKRSLRTSSVVKFHGYSDAVPAEQVIGYQTVKAGEMLNLHSRVDGNS